MSLSDLPVLPDGNIPTPFVSAKHRSSEQSPSTALIAFLLANKVELDSSHGTTYNTSNFYDVQVQHSSYDQPLILAVLGSLVLPKYKSFPPNAVISTLEPASTRTWVLLQLLHGLLSNNADNHKNEPELYACHTYIMKTFVDKNMAYNAMAMFAAIQKFTPWSSQPCPLRLLLSFTFWTSAITSHFRCLFLFLDCFRFQTQLWSISHKLLF